MGIPVIWQEFFDGFNNITCEIPRNSWEISVSQLVESSCLSKGVSLCFISESLGDFPMDSSINAAIWQILELLSWVIRKSPDDWEMKQRDTPLDKFDVWGQGTWVLLHSLAMHKNSQ